MANVGKSHTVTTTPPPARQRTRSYLALTIRHHLELTAQAGFRHWLGLGLGQPQTPGQTAALKEMAYWLQTLAMKVRKSLLNEKEMNALAVKLVQKKETAADGSINPENYARRWAAFYAAVRLLTTLLLDDRVVSPSSMKEFVSLADEVCEAVYPATRPSIMRDGTSGAIIQAVTDTVLEAIEIKA